MNLISPSNLCIRALDGLRLIRLGTLLPCLFLFNSGGHCASLQEGWWSGQSPQQILERAEAITSSLEYFHGIKPERADAIGVGREEFRRRLAPGTNESKTVFFRGGRPFLIGYRLLSGRYDQLGQRVIKLEYEEPDREALLAREVEQPYTYRLIGRETVGTNQCIVVSRIATSEFLNHMSKVLFPGESNAPTKDFDLLEALPAEHRFYIREADGVVLGRVVLNARGQILDHAVYEIVEVNVPILDSEFAIPNQITTVATNFSDFKGKALGIVPERAIPQRLRYLVIGVMAVCTLVWGLIVILKKPKH